MDVFNPDAIKAALADAIADHPPPLVVVMPAAWRPLIEANPEWAAGARVVYDDEVLIL
jgi:hypothetical protein